MRKTITLEWDDCGGEYETLSEFMDEYILDELRGTIKDLDLSDKTIEFVLRILDKAKLHFERCIVESEDERRNL